uniref:Uncharacterized protein n=1 Tax=Fagus sylvatica TaxID=28930 RepID=A0A2N9FPE2_FAGSY
MGFGVRWPWDLVAMGFGGRGLLAQSDVCDGPPIEALVVRLFPDLGSWWYCEIVSGSVGDGDGGGSHGGSQR